MTNFWQPRTMPHSWYDSNSVSPWNGLDNLHNLERNPEAEKWKNMSIEYRRNDLGFRTHDLKPMLGNSVDVALGCSFTEGVGLPAELTWPHLIEQRTTRTLLNLGLGGGSTDTVARILTNICGLYDIKNVFILWPELARFELYFADHARSPILSLVPSQASVEHTWNMDSFNSTQRFNRNQSIANMLADKHGFNIVERNIMDAPTLKPIDFARDGCHWGIRSNQEMADWCLDKLTQ
jgi:hypothetical protein